MVASLIPPALLKRQRAYGAAYALSNDKLAFADPQGVRLGVDEGAMSATFRITSNTPDRVGDVVDSQGIHVENYAQNAIWLLNHMSEGLPIGKARDPQGQLCVFPEADQTIATCFFSQRTKDAEQVFALVAEDILRATSIGFNPLSPPVPRGRGEMNPHSLESGLYFPEIDLLEISVVCIPCQPQATLLRSHLSRGKIAGAAIGERLRKSLAPFAEAAPVQVTSGFAGGSMPTSKNWVTIDGRHVWINDGNSPAPHALGSGRTGAGRTPSNKPSHANEPTLSSLQAKIDRAQAEQRRAEQRHLEAFPGSPEDDRAKQAVIDAKIKVTLAQLAYAEQLLNEAQTEQETATAKTQIVAAKQRLSDLGYSSQRRGFAAAAAAAAQSQPQRNKPMSKKWSKGRSKRMAQPETVTKREFSQAQRDRAADSGSAMPDGSFPISNADDLKNAIHAVGRAKDPKAARAHISRRAHALNLQHLLPDGWNDRPGGHGANPKDDKAMSASSGAAGGYGIAPEPSAPDHEQIKAEMCKVMDQHAGGAADRHEAHFKAETGEVMHVHGMGADDLHLKAVKEGLEGIDGVKAVHQSAGTPPAEDAGYEKAYPPVDKAIPDGDGDADDAADDGTTLEDEFKKKAQLAYHLGRGKAIRELSIHLKDAATLAASAQARAQEIADEHPELDADQLTSIAYSLCQDKALAGYAAKDAADGDPQATALPEEDSGAVVPPSLKLCQQACEIIESALPGLEPETREFWEGILGEIQDHGSERYPGAFDADDDDDSGADADDDDDDQDEASAFADQVVDAYRKQQKAQQRAYRKSMQALQKGNHLQIIKGVADYCHAMSDKALGYTLNKNDKALLKGHGRALDAVHGAASADAPQDAAPAVPESPSDDGDGDADDQPVEKAVPDAASEIDRLFAVVEKSIGGTNGSAPSAAEERVDALRERLTSIFGTRF